MGLVSELRRRNVFRVAIAYVIIAWLILQVGDTLAPALHLGEWVNTALAFFLILGLPIALIFAWAYELTPEGLKKEKEVDRSQSITHHTGRKLDFIIIGVLSVTVLYFVFDSFILTSETTSTTEVEKSIAILPFVAMSSGEDDEHFSDGLTEELINSLVQIDELKVTGRTSSFYYKGKNEDLRTIGLALGVAHVLECSLRRSGDKLRITAQLTQSSDGFHLWSNTYDRNADDIFSIQTDIATKVAEALKVTLLGEDLNTLSNYGTTNAEARSLYLIAKARFRQVSNSFTIWTSDNQLRSARSMLEDVVRIDPDYAEAWVALANALLVEAWLLPTDSDDPMTPESAVKRAIEAIGVARKLEPDLPGIKLVEAELLASSDIWQIGDVAGVERTAQAYEEALAAAPNDVEVLEAAADFYSGIDRQKAADLYQQALLIDPLSDTRLWRADVLAADNPAEARKEYIRTGELYPESSWMLGMANLEVRLGHLHHALVWSEDRARDYIHRILVWTSLGAPEMALQELAALPDKGQDKLWNERAAFLITRDYQRYRDWAHSDAVRAEYAKYGSGDSLCRLNRNLLPLFYVRDWEAAALAIDDCFEDYSRDRSEMTLGTPAGRVLGRDLNANAQMRLTLQIASWAYVYRQVGWSDEAASMWNWASELTQLEPLGLSDKQKKSKMHLKALIHAGMGQEEAALETFESLYDAGWRHPLMGGTGLFVGFFGDWGWFEDNPMLDSIRDKPRFKVIVARIQADNAKLLAEYRAGISRDDIIDEDLGELAAFDAPIN